MLIGCGKKNIIKQTEVVSGGTRDDSDYDAPKTINSDELISFHTEFFRYGDSIYDVDRRYIFTMTKSDEGIVITEGNAEELKCATDNTFVQKLIQIIKDYKLEELNGIDRQTYGLSPDYGPYWLEAEYASGEKLYFYMNGDPYAEWTWEVLDLFAREFGEHGIDDLLPPKENSKMTRFELEYVCGDIRYSYGETNVPMTEDHYEALKEIADDMELMRFQNGMIFPAQFDYDNTSQYYEFYVEYESGTVMSGFSDDPGQCEKFKPVAEKFLEYYEEYLETNKD